MLGGSPEKERPVKRLGVGLALYWWDEKQQVLYLLAKRDKIKPQEEARARFRGGTLKFTPPHTSPSEYALNILGGGIRKKIENPLAALLREAKEEGWVSAGALNLFDPKNLVKQKPLVLWAQQQRKGEMTVFGVYLWPIEVDLSTLTSFVKQSNDFSLIEIKPDQITNPGGQQIVCRPPLWAAAARIIDIKQERGVNEIK